MIRRIHRLYFIWQLDKEEAWINEMASHGYSLIGCGRLYFDFEETDPGKYKYKTLFLRGSYTGKKNMDFFSFLDEVGIKVTSYIQYPGTCCVYTRASAEDYPDGIDIYSDIDSKITYEWTAFWYLIFCAVAMFGAGLLNLSMALRHNAFWVCNYATAILCFILMVVSFLHILKTIAKIVKLKKERAIHE
ncbi:MAG: DUF2812 domain-containing protein [Clostridia bacterium]|nr:DUF2812 domain-containing protein [Clostridia bacterium]